MTINKAGSADWRRILDAYENLDACQGLLRRYTFSFTPDRHEARGSEQMSMVCFDSDGAVVRVAPH